MTTATKPTAKLRVQSEELKDAYRVWLKDLYDDKPENVLRKLDRKKKLSGGRARRKQRTEHAQQHTAASALKDVALKKAGCDKLPSLSSTRTPAAKQALQDSQNRRHQALVDEANYSSFQYAHQPSWRPGLAFFQQFVRLLTQKTSPEVDNGLEGVVLAELDNFPVLVAPILFRVSLRGHGGGNRFGVALLFCQEHNQEQQQGAEANGDAVSYVLNCRVYSRKGSWRGHRNILLDIISNSSAEVCAVRKCAENFESRNNDLQILRSRQEVEKAIDELWSASANGDYDSDLLAIQKYIPFKGASSNINAFTTTSTSSPAERKAWIARCASRKRDKNSSTVWIISGGDASDSSSSMATTNTSSADCQLVKCSIDQAWSVPRLLASMCIMPLEKALRVRFNELVVDLLQDTSGIWWLLQVKAFTLASTRPASAATVASLSSSKMTPRGLSRTQSAPTRFENESIPTPQWRKWRCAGRYCATKSSNKKSFEPANQQLDKDTEDDKEPSGYLTKKMLRGCEFYDDFVQQQDVSLAGGFTEFNSALAFHLQHRLPKRDRSQLYEPQPLCNACLRRYHSLRQQWIESVEAPKTSTTTNIKAGQRKTPVQSKMYIEHADQILPPPHKLPSLHHDSAVLPSLTASYSTPVLPGLNVNTHKTSQADPAIEPKHSNYLDELAAMEEMLAEHEPPSISTKTNHDVQSSARSRAASSTLLTTQPPVHDDIFPKWDGVARIEEMWHNLRFKPLERQLTDPGDSLTDGGGYNSISLHHELAKVAKTSDNNEENNKHTIPDPKFVTVYTVHIQHCRRVFEDDMYREELVNDALSALRSGKPNVCFVVAPPNRNIEIAKDEVELVEMALRSLYIDVKQAVAASSDEFPSELQPFSWPMRPKVCRETSGCISVKLGHG